MKHGSNSRRGRSRGGGKRHSSPRNQTFDSNGPEGKVRGTPQQILDKYLSLARDASAAGEHITAEGFYQFAEHYYRILNADQQARQRAAESQQAQQDEDDENAADDSSSDDQADSGDSRPEQRAKRGGNGGRRNGVGRAASRAPEEDRAPDDNETGATSEDASDDSPGDNAEPEPTETAASA